MAHQTIIVPLDGSEYSERALPVATTLADRAGADLLLVTAAIGGPLHIRNYLNEKAEDLRSGRCRVEVLRTPHGPVEALVQAVEETDDPVICMTTHGRGRLRWAAVGSVAEEVLRRVDDPDCARRPALPARRPRPFLASPCMRRRSRHRGGPGAGRRRVGRAPRSPDRGCDRRASARRGERRARTRNAR